MNVATMDEVRLKDVVTFIRFLHRKDIYRYFP